MTRPPWFEATAALAAAGHDPSPPQPVHPVARSLIMADSPHYAFLPRIDAVCRPVVFADLMSLARHIERHRHGQGLQLIDVEEIEYAGRIYAGVKIILLDMANDPERCLGFAYLRGSGQEALRPALRAARLQAEQASRLAVVVGPPGPPDPTRPGASPMPNTPRAGPTGRHPVAARAV